MSEREDFEEWSKNPDRTDARCCDCREDAKDVWHAATEAANARVLAALPPDSEIQEYLIKNKCNSHQDTWTAVAHFIRERIIESSEWQK